MRVTGVDACRRGWVAVSLEVAQADTARGGTAWAGLARAGTAQGGTARAGTAQGGTARAGAARGGGLRVEAVRVHESLAGVLGAEALEGDGVGVVGIDMPLGLLESGWREADLAARGLLGPRRGSVFAIPPRAVWAETSYQAANQRCRELTGRGFSIQAWGLRTKLLEADRYRGTCGHQLYEVHPELAFGAMAGAPLAHSKHTAAGRDLRRALLSQVGLTVPLVPPAPVTDTLDAAAVAWSTWRIATGRAVTLPARPQHDRCGRQIAIRY